MDAKLQGYIDKLNALNFKEMYNGDFFLTWEKTDDEIEAVFTVADALRYMRENNISTKVFESGLGISLFRDNSTRTRFSFASACNLLGLEVQDLDEGKSQVAHGETVRETANMISFMADVIGIRDDMYIGKGNKYMHEVVDAVTEGNKDGILEQKPTLVNLQCDIDHPTQAMADMLHIIHEFGGVENLKGIPNMSLHKSFTFLIIYTADIPETASLPGLHLFYCALQALYYDTPESPVLVLRYDTESASRLVPARH